MTRPWVNTSDPTKVGNSGMLDTGLYLVGSRNQGCNGLFLLYSTVEVWSLIVVIIKPLDSDCHRETLPVLLLLDGSPRLHHSAHLPLCPRRQSTF
jgi:hypothetical protein